MDDRLKKIIDRSDSIVFFGGAGVSTERGSYTVQSKALNRKGLGPG